MKVLYLAELLTEGGTAKHLAELLPRLRDAGVDPVVWSRGKQGKYAGQLQDSGVQVIVRNSLGKSLMSGDRTRGFDLVHSYLYGSHLSDVAACWLRRLPYVMSTRNSGHWFVDRPAVRLRVAIRSKLVRNHLANSQGVSEYLATREGVSRERIAVIHNGMVDRHGEGPFLSRGDFGLENTDFVMLSVAWLKPHKSVDFLIRSLCRMIASRPRIRLLIVGDGPEEASLRRLANELGVARSCVFIGRHAQTHLLARIADVSVSASEREGMSNSSIEALMMGLPVVACAEAGGNREIVEDGINGYLYPFGDQAQFCAAVATLHDDADLRSRASVAARRTFLSRFSMAEQVRGFLDLYRTVLSRHVGRAGDSCSTLSRMIPR